MPAADRPSVDRLRNLKTFHRATFTVVSENRCSGHHHNGSIDAMSSHAQGAGDDGEEEEEDYMSDAFLAAATTAPTKGDFRRDNRDVRRLRELEEKRKRALEEQRLRNPSKKARVERERETLSAGLETPLDESNKGFAMLQRMGYKQGSGLGRNQTGRVEPVAIELKADRQGFGLENAKRIGRALMDEARARQLKKLTPAREVKEADLASFRNRMRNKFSLKQAVRDLEKSQRLCQQLDCEKGLEDFGLWPEVPAPEEQLLLRAPVATTAEPEEPVPSVLAGLEPMEQLGVATRYLREAHLFCLWCGHAYDSPEDLLNNCPGPSAADHDE